MLNNHIYSSSIEIFLILTNTTFSVCFVKLRPYLHEICGYELDAVPKVHRPLELEISFSNISKNKKKTIFSNWNTKN